MSSQFMFKQLSNINLLALILGTACHPSPGDKPSEHGSPVGKNTGTK